MNAAGGVVAGAGALLMVLAALGTVRLPDVFARLHAATKATSLGLGLVLAGTVLSVPAGDVAVKALVAVVFQFATAPVAAHVIGRAAYRAGVPRDLETDELAGGPDATEAARGARPPSDAG